MAYQAHKVLWMQAHARIIEDSIEKKIKSGLSNLSTTGIHRGQRKDPFAYPMRGGTSK